MHISCLLFASNGSPKYKSLTKTKKYSELEAHERLKRVASSNAIIKVSKGAKIRNRYNQVPHLTQDTNGRVTNSQFDTSEPYESSSLITVKRYAMVLSFFKS